MRLQLIRYESVELTEQLMERQEGGDRGGAGDKGPGGGGDGDAEADCTNQEVGGAGGGAGEGGAALDGGQADGTGAEEVSLGPVIHVQSGTNDQGESVFYVLTSAGPSQALILPTAPEDGEARADSVMMQLQETAQQLGMEVV